MQPHKLTLDSFADEQFELIAIHTVLEDFRLAYLLNKTLNLRLARTSKDLDFKHGLVHANYVLFKYFNEAKMINYYLINNHYKADIQSHTTHNTLFNADTACVAAQLLPELKKVDYLLKIEEPSLENRSSEILSCLNASSYISSAYSVEPHQIKNKENLIFE